MCGNVARITDIDEVNKWLNDNNKKIVCVHYAGNTISNTSRFRCLIDGYEWNSSYSNIKHGNHGCLLSFSAVRCVKYRLLNMKISTIYILLIRHIVTH